MKKLQKIYLSLTKQQIFFPALLLLILAVSFVILVPKVSSRLFVLKRQMLWDTFLANTIKNNRVDPQEFWEFREFYSPGYFVFSREGISQEKIHTAEQHLGFDILDRNIFLTFLDFSSPYITSFDSLTQKSTLSDVFTPSKNNTVKILFQEKNTIILRNGNSALLLFLLSLDDMKKANGFFDYTEKDKSIVENKYWVDATFIQLD